jgi:N-acetylneuraminic acid mutarotase
MKISDRLCRLELGSHLTKIYAELVLVLLFVGFISQGLLGASFIATGSLANSRNSHTATLLPNGKLLIAGGYHSGSPFYLSSAELYDPATGTWTSTASLTNARVDHTATLLTNGWVLVVGGQGSSGALFSAELYDPTTGTWKTTLPLTTARYRHTATLLRDGRVLVAGGTYYTINGPVYPREAELYDPATGSWSAADSLGTGRESHTATLLPDGRVLIAGGTGAGILASVELYNPVSNAWTTTGALNTGRTVHTATLLPDGRVLTAGGSGGNSSAEIYDPATGNWTFTGAMNAVRWSPTATLLPSGKVLLTGGYLNNGGTPSYFSSAELFDPALGKWTLTTSMSTIRYSHSATLLANGRVLVVAGAGTNSSTIASAELYDSAVGTWTPTGSLNAPDSSRNSAILLPNGKVLIASAEVYDPAAGTWTNTPPLTHGRIDCKATLLPSGKVLISGGLDAGTRDSIPLSELYDPESNTWTATGNMNISRYDHRATLLPNGKVLASGGFHGVYPSGSIVAAGEIYDPVTGNWTTTGSMSIGRDGHTATLLTNGLVLVTGGTRFVGGGFTEVVNCDLYNPATGLWTATGSLNARRSSHTATLLPDGRVMVTGGHYYQSGTFFRNATELYNPATGTWTLTGAMINLRGSHTATLLPNGMVLVAGGRQTTSGASFAGAELFDPAAGRWTVTAQLINPRVGHSAILLPSGKVLAVGGSPDNGMSYLTSTELYDVGLGFSPNWQPQIQTITSPLVSGASLALGGNSFRGISEASSGNSQNSASDHPSVQLRNIESEQTVFLNAAAWSSNSFNSSPVNALFPGWSLATVFVNGIPSSSTVNLLKALATVTLGNLVQTYTGAGRSVSVTTSPAGLPVNLTYDGSAQAPTNVGSYTLVATVANPNYQGSTTNTLVIVHQLTAATATFLRARDLGLRIDISELLTNVASLPADINTFVLTGAGPSAQGATIFTNATFIMYSSTNNTDDSFTYSVGDGAGGSATGLVLVKTIPAVGASLPPNSITVSGNTATITAFGIPGYSYVLQSATNINGPWWTVGTNAASTTDGSLLFLDPNATNSQQYYRTAQPSP